MPHYRVISEITFTQQPTADFPGRKKTYVYNFVNEAEASDGWESFCNKARVVLPRNVFVKDGNGRLVSLGATTTNFSGFSANPPIFLRGDSVKIRAGYKYYDASGNEVAPMFTIFTGFISEVSSHKPVTILCEDSAYILKTTNCKTKTYKGYSVEGMMQDIIESAGLPFTVNQKTQTTLGTFVVTESETIAHVLQRLKKDFNFESYFRGSELRCGAFRYIDEDFSGQPIQVFAFQSNIISDELQYNRLDDLTLSVIAANKIQGETGRLTKDGAVIMDTHRIEALVTLTNKGVTTYVKKNRLDPYPPNTDGERRTMFFPGAKTVDDLTSLAVAELKKYYYTGLKGKFVTFGIPFVRQGQAIDIVDNVLPERSGRYRVRGVEYSVGVSGFRQTIELDYKINI